MPTENGGNCGNLVDVLVKQNSIAADRKKAKNS